MTTHIPEAEFRECRHSEAALPVANEFAKRQREKIRAMQERPVLTEVITWTPVATPPDDDITVLLFHPDASNPVWPGYRDGRRWRTAEGFIIAPTHWAYLPEGPK